ncbi:bifunctional protein FolD 2-like [Malus domestica]|uniref:bifunctional protein FolD 2-like n=1 Tax=Malus domestica TaxID=3750 RepID=UPI0039770080
MPKRLQNPKGPRIFDHAENNRLLLRKSFRACPSKGPVVIPNIDLVGYAYQFVAVLNLCRGVISIKGKKAVVGRSNIVGLPVSLLLLKADATITVVHSRTPDPESFIREADIIIAAAGQAMMIKGSCVKPGVAVIVVGTNAIDDPSRKSGYRLVGDVDF